MLAKATRIEDCKNIVDVMEKAKLNFVPEQHEVITANGITCPNHKAIVRSDNQQVLSIMGKNYTPFAPANSFAIADILRERYSLDYTRAISIEGGRRIIIEAETPNPIRIGPKPLDWLKKRVHVADSFDGSIPTSAEGGLFAPACTNLQIWRAKETRSVKIRHTKNAERRLEQAIRVWAGMNHAWEAFINKARMLTEKIVGVSEVDRFLDSVVGKIEKETSTRKKNQREDIERLFRAGRGTQGKTAWDLYNAVTQYYDHEVLLGQEDKRLASAIYGTGADQKTKAMNTALAL